MYCVDSLLPLREKVPVGRMRGNKIAMQVRNTSNRFGIVMILFHWLMAILIIAMLALGLYMIRLPIGALKLKLYGWHKELGVLILMLAALRITWRLANTMPILTLPWWEILAAKTLHWAFYGFMFAMPISGWLMTSASGLPVSFFGLFLLPDLISPNEHLRVILLEIHRWLA